MSLVSVADAKIPVALPIGPQDPLDEPFWQGLREGVLRIQHCAGCGNWIWEPSWVCPACHRFDPVWATVEPVGVVYSWTTTRHAFPASMEFAGALPYTTALVSLPHAGHRRVLGIVIDGDVVKIGTRVRGCIQPASDLTGGWPVLRWRVDDTDTASTDSSNPGISRTSKQDR
jgi:uncharacterized OB-fold protein